MATGLPARIEDAALRGLVWALIGGIFALVFVVLREALRGMFGPPLDILAAAIAAAALTALLYGSMRLTVVAANLTFIAMLVFTWVRGAGLALEPLVIVGAVVGVVVGTLYGLFDRRSRIYCAEAKVVAGVVSGAVAGATAILVARFYPNISGVWLAVIIGPIGTLIYVNVAHWFVRHCQHWLPAGANGALVGLGVGGFTGLFFMVLAGSLDPSWIADIDRRELVVRIHDYWMEAVLACAAASCLIGIARSLLRTPWYDL
jgi:hypothetical protein